MHVVVTGANGFVGRALCRTLVSNGHRVTGIVRRVGTAPAGVVESVHAAPEFADIATQWPASPGNVDCVVHLAARVHVMNESESDETQRAFDATNVEGALRVARSAQRNGVRRFVYVSSIKAIAGSGSTREPLREDAVALPDDAYGRSKLAAERSLADLRHETGLDVVIVRPPLVYGQDVGANFRKMLDAVWSGVPLPFGAVVARRSLLFVDNLADALMHCAFDARAANACFHVADEVAPSVADLLRAIGTHLGRPARLIPVPVPLLKLAGHLTGKSAQIERLTEGLVLDSSEIRRQLSGWQPPYTLDDGLRATAEWYRAWRKEQGLA
ncbi:N-acetyl-alpha-D-glucosaminyl-diphospho-ditrans, octacis-undecaprenol 4-epimerase [Paraburkholderia hiiakae]|uniref:N-acetyl-alpha-D-glucosaminyl-diphospho-ditrans, octacis-undecaprenol 4-epimerase n=1 Tax=Paraburkholderia hiiakae TaxID=1081782 RepID=A0ABM8N9A8_9BURK|nr:NAD-dependent epimerase/dehydratase family protein [Paraburkholderia hiiakae]CAD6509482.1 N-acetyl-alpha-D-glucosaminyl-diphospho-ditrans, octacis-undecaprenol 4-epimerase [Paraburkholderia hiiakae]